MLKTAHEAYEKAAEIDKQLAEIFEESENTLENLKNNLLLCRTIKTTIDIYEMIYNKDISKLLAK